MLIILLIFVRDEAHAHVPVIFFHQNDKATGKNIDNNMLMNNNPLARNNSVYFSSKYIAIIYSSITSKFSGHNYNQCTNFVAITIFDSINVLHDTIYANASPEFFIGSKNDGRNDDYFIKIESVIK